MVSLITLRAMNCTSGTGRAILSVNSRKGPTVITRAGISKSQVILCSWPRSLIVGRVMHSSERTQDHKVLLMLRAGQHNEVECRNPTLPWDCERCITRLALTEEVICNGLITLLQTADDRMELGFQAFRETWKHRPGVTFEMTSILNSIETLLTSDRIVTLKCCLRDLWGNLNLKARLALRLNEAFWRSLQWIHGSGPTWREEWTLTFSLRSSANSQPLESMCLDWTWTSQSITHERIHQKWTERSTIKRS